VCFPPIYSDFLLARREKECPPLEPLVDLKLSAPIMAASAFWGEAGFSRSHRKTHGVTRKMIPELMKMNFRFDEDSLVSTSPTWDRFVFRGFSDSQAVFIKVILMGGGRRSRSNRANLLAIEVAAQALAARKSLAQGVRGWAIAEVEDKEHNVLPDFGIGIIVMDPLPSSFLHPYELMENQPLGYDAEIGFKYQHLHISRRGKFTRNQIKAVLAAAQRLNHLCILHVPMYFHAENVLLTAEDPVHVIFVNFDSSSAAVPLNSNTVQMMVVDMLGLLSTESSSEENDA